MSMQPIITEFVGPFSWIDGGGVACIREAKAGEQRGVYLWTVRIDEGELVYYVGQTGRSFSERMTEHFKEHMSGGYHLYEPGEFSRGRKVQLWPGWYSMGRQRHLSVFMQRLPELMPAIVHLAKLYRFYLAPMTCERRLLERIESGLAKHLYEQPGMVGEFQDEGIRYRRRKDTEEPVEAQIRCEQNLIGVPESLWV